MECALDVAGREVGDPRARFHALVFGAQMRRALPITTGIHVFQQAAEVFGDEISPQRPGRVDVAEG